MKTTFLKLTCILFLAVAGIACSSDDDGGAGGGSASNGQVVASIDGQGFESFSNTGGQSGGNAIRIDNGNVTSIIVTGIDLEGQSIILTMNSETLAVGSYDLSDANNIAFTASYTRVDTQTFQSTSYLAPFENSGDVGTITIDALTETNIQGTFEFMAANQNDANDTVSVTNGSFNLDFM